MSNFKKPLVFKNKQYKKIEKDYLGFFATAANWPSNKETVEINDLRHVFFELSNLCNYASIHPQCPVSWQKKIIFSLVGELCPPYGSSPRGLGLHLTRINSGRLGVSDRLGS